MCGAVAPAAAAAVLAGGQREGAGGGMEGSGTWRAGVVAILYPRRRVGVMEVERRKGYKARVELEVDRYPLYVSLAFFLAFLFLSLLLLSLSGAGLVRADGQKI